MKMKKLSNEDKKAIKNGLNAGYSFDEMIETLEAREKNENYVKISYDSAASKVELVGATRNILTAILTIVSKMIGQQDSVGDKLAILQKLNHWTASEAFRLKEQYERDTDCSGPISNNVAPEVNEILKGIFRDKFSEDGQK